MRKVIKIILFILFTSLSFHANSCEKVTDENIQFQIDLCSAHIGCRFVAAIADTCTKTKEFINNLKSRFDLTAQTRGKGYTSAEIDSEIVFDSYLSDNQKKVEELPEWRLKVDSARVSVREYIDNVITGSIKNSDVKWLYMGESNNHMPDGNGYRYFSNGEIQRGSFSKGKLEGNADILKADGSRITGLISESTGKGDLLVLDNTGQVFNNKNEEISITTSSSDQLTLKHTHSSLKKSTLNEIFDSKDGLNLDKDDPYSAASDELSKDVIDKKGKEFWSKKDSLAQIFNAVGEVTKILNDKKETKSISKNRNVRENASETFHTNNTYESYPNTIPENSNQTETIAANSSNTKNSPRTIAKPARQCVQILTDEKGYRKFKNICSYRIELAWCYINDDCKYGKYGYNNTWSISPGGTWPAGREQQVWYGACNIPHSIVDDSAGDGTFVCR